MAPCFARDALKHLLDRFVQLGRIVFGRFLQFRRDVVQRVGDDTVHHDQRPCDRLVRADAAELETIACESERAGAVAVTGVTGQGGQGVHADRQRSRFDGTACGTAFELIEHIFELFAEEDRDDGRRRFVGSQAVVVARGSDRSAQQGGVFVDRANGGGAEHEELRVLMRGIAGIEQVAELAAQRPVDVLARTVDSGERLLVQQAGHAVFRRHALQLQHDDVLMIVREIGALVDRSDLELTGRNFIMAGLDRNALFVELMLGFHHERQHTLGDRAEIVVFELLAFWRLRAEERPARIEQVGAGEEEVAVDQEVLLLGASGRGHHTGIVVSEQFEDTLRLLIQGLHGAQERRFVVQRLACPRKEGGRDTERVAVGVLVDIGRTGYVPGRVAAGLKGRADSARWKNWRRRALPGSARCRRTARWCRLHRPGRKSCRVSPRSDW